eukprot:jgi/Mesvir1/21188/Mv08648-RA.1
MKLSTDKHGGMSRQGGIPDFSLHNVEFADDHNYWQYNDDAEEDMSGAQHLPKSSKKRAKALRKTGATGGGAVDMVEDDAGVSDSKDGEDILERPLVWIDLEMTGLDCEKDHILEIACIITDGRLRKEREGPDLVIHYGEDVLANMNDWCKEHHARSGLTQRVAQSKLSLKQAEQQVLEFVRRHSRYQQCNLAGNSVHMDYTFLKKHMPTLADHLHYRIVDVSSISELCYRWYPSDAKRAPTKKSTHRAMTDIRESIEELRYLRRFQVEGTPSELAGYSQYYGCQLLFLSRTAHYSYRILRTVGSMRIITSGPGSPAHMPDVSTFEALLLTVTMAMTVMVVTAGMVYYRARVEGGHEGKKHRIMSGFLLLHRGIKSLDVKVLGHSRRNVPSKEHHRAHDKFRACINQTTMPGVWTASGLPCMSVVASKTSAKLPGNGPQMTENVLAEQAKHSRRFMLATNQGPDRLTWFPWTLERYYTSCIEVRGFDLTFNGSPQLNRARVEMKEPRALCLTTIGAGQACKQEMIVEQDGLAKATQGLNEIDIEKGSNNREWRGNCNLTQLPFYEAPKLQRPRLAPCATRVELLFNGHVQAQILITFANALREATCVAHAWLRFACVNTTGCFLSGRRSGMQNKQMEKVRISLEKATPVTCSYLLRELVKHTLYMNNQMPDLFENLIDKACSSELLKPRGPAPDVANEHGNERLHNGAHGIGCTVANGDHATAEESDWRSDGLTCDEQEDGQGRPGTGNGEDEGRGAALSGEDWDGVASGPRPKRRCQRARRKGRLMEKRLLKFVDTLERLLLSLAPSALVSAPDTDLPPPPSLPATSAEAKTDTCMAAPASVRNGHAATQATHPGSVPAVDACVDAALILLGASSHRPKEALLVLLPTLQPDVAARSNASSCPPRALGGLPGGPGTASLNQAADATGWGMKDDMIRIQRGGNDDREDVTGAGIGVPRVPGVTLKDLFGDNEALRKECLAASRKVLRGLMSAGVATGGGIKGSVKLFLLLRGRVGVPLPPALAGDSSSPEDDCLQSSGGFLPRNFTAMNMKKAHVACLDLRCVRRGAGEKDGGALELQVADLESSLKGANATHVW